MGMFFSQRSITPHTFVVAECFQIDQLAKWRTPNTIRLKLSGKTKHDIKQGHYCYATDRICVNSATIKKQPINRTVTVRLRHSASGQLPDSSQGSGDSSEKT